LLVFSVQQARPANEAERRLILYTRAIVIAALLAGSSTVPIYAQTVVDMSLVSCDQLLKSPQERKDVERLDGRLPIAP
jgi:hypothetical protein